MAVEHVIPPSSAIIVSETQQDVIRQAALLRIEQDSEAVLTLVPPVWFQVE